MMLPVALVLCLLQEPSIEELIRRLDSDTLAERDEAQKKLKARGREALPLLEKAAQRSDPEVSSRAKRLLDLAKLAEREQLTPQILSELPDLDENLLAQGDDAWVRVLLGRTEEGLKSLQPSTRSLVVPRAAKHAGNLEDRLRVVQILDRFPIPEAAPALVSYFLSPTEEKKDSEELFKAAIAVLLRMKAKRELFRVVIDYGNDRSERRFANPNITSEAFRALVQLKASEEILEIARNAESHCSGDAVQAMGEIGGPEITGELLKFLSSKNVWVRHHAAVALGKRGAKEAQPGLSVMLSDSEGPPRRAAAEALARLGSREDIPRILPLVRDDRTWVQVSAMRALSLLEAKEAIPALQDVQTHKDPAVRAIAGESLALLRGNEAIPELLPMLKDPEAVVRLYVAVALSRLGCDQAVPVLIRLSGIEGQVYLNVNDRWSGGGFESPPRAFLVLNGIRSPETWSRLAKVRLSREAGGMVLADLDQFAKEAGLSLALSPELEKVKATLSDKQYYSIVIPGKTPLLDALSWFSVSMGFDILIEGPLFRVMTRPEAVLAWKAWYVARQPAAPEAAAFKEDLLRAAMPPAERAALEARERDEAKAKHRKDRARALESVWTPALKARFGERLLDGDEETWAAIALEIQAKPGEGKKLAPDDLGVLILRGQQGATKIEDRVKILGLANGLASKPLEKVLLDLLRDPEGSLRWAAATQLDPHAHGREILSLASDPSPGVRRVVADRLHDLYPRECLEIYRELSLTEDGQLSDWATMMLQFRAGPDLIPHMIGLLGRPTSNSGAVRCVLGYLGRQGAREAVPRILALLDEERPTCFPQAMQALLELGARDSVSRILGVARKDPGTLALAVPLIEAFDVREARPDLYSLLERGDSYNQERILLALARMGDRDSLGTIRKFLQHSSETTRAGACEALALLEGPAARKDVLEVFKDPDATPYKALMRSEAREAVPQLRDRLATHGAEVIEALMYFGAAEALPQILAVLGKNSTIAHFSEGLKAVARSYPRESIPVLRTHLASKESNPSTLAAALLCEGGSSDGVPVLLENQQPSLSLNALRSPESWRPLCDRKIDRTLYGTGSKLLELVASEAGLKLEDLPAACIDAKAWTGHHYLLPQGLRPLRLIEVLERLEDRRWAFILERDAIRVVPREEALRIWKAWWASKK